MNGHVRLSHIIHPEDAASFPLIEEPVIIKVRNQYDQALMNIFGPSQRELARAGARFIFEKKFADLILKLTSGGVNGGTIEIL